MKKQLYQEFLMTQENTEANRLYFLFGVLEMVRTKILPQILLFQEKGNLNIGM